MSMFDTLKIATVTRDNTGANDPVVRVRAKLVASIVQQEEAVKAQIEGKPFKVQGTRYKQEGGQRVAENVDKKFRPWWFAKGGIFYSELRYGTSAMELPGGTAIECGKKLEDVLKVYGVVKKGVEAGELDDTLLKLAGERGRRNKRDAAPATPAAPAGKAPGKAK